MERTVEPAVVEFAQVNGVRIAYERTGESGDPLVFVHGSWGSHHNWDPVVPRLAGEFRVVTYDRRGHSDSERPQGPGSVHEDVADLAALIEYLDIAPAWVVGNSYGSIITLRLASARPDVLRGIVVHEPPLFTLLDDGGSEAAALEEIRSGPLAEVYRRLTAGDHAGAAELFVEQVALGPGSWAKLPEDLRQTFIVNAPTYLDEMNDPDALTVDEAALARFTAPTLITEGDQSPPIFPAVLERLAGLMPHAERVVYPGAGHIPHITHPVSYVDELVAFTSAATS